MDCDDFVISHWAAGEQMEAERSIKLICLLRARCSALHIITNRCSSYFSIMCPLSRASSPSPEVQGELLLNVLFLGRTFV